MSAFEDQQRDTNRLRQRADETDRRFARVAQEDVVVEYPRRLLLRSPNGTFFALTVDDSGAIGTTTMGTSL